MINELNKEEREEAIAHHMQAIMLLLEIESTEGTKDTPKRVARMLVDELCATVDDRGMSELLHSMKSFSEPTDNREVIVNDIHFHSICEHHFLPFFGKCSVSYTPKSRVIGLSKIPRIVHYFSARPQLQERLTQDIANFIMEVFEVERVEVKLYDVEHLCVSMRGAKTCIKTNTRVILPV
jgi:GTP cyclohydrolase I